MGKKHTCSVELLELLELLEDKIAQVPVIASGHVKAGEHGGNGGTTTAHDRTEARVRALETVDVIEQVIDSQIDIIL